MATIIILALALTLVQIWILPAISNLNNIDYLISNRQGEVETSAIYNRISRAATNLLESLPAFLALCLLSMQLDIDITDSARYWLWLRVSFLVSYAAGIIYLRTALWLGSIGCLIGMALQLM
ncbi:MAG: MAPEG family protein [Porticoccaceae bacterium]|nr:MAPEG family protein [Porticoccaceae bacterium]